MTEAARDYDTFARRMLQGGILSDPWLEGVARFVTTPETISPRAWREMARAAEKLAAVYDEVCGIVEDDPALLDGFFGLTPAQKVMWHASAPLWHGIARADVFETAEGLAVAELNCDTPTGEAEAVELARLCADAAPGCEDPSAQLGARFGAMLEAVARGWLKGTTSRTAGIVYPTEFTEDLCLVKLYRRRWLEDAGYDVVLGSPYNLGRAADGRATLFDTPVSVLVRHYKTDWWGERASAWDDDPITDTTALTEPLAAALGAFVDRRTVVANPFGAVVPQNKRAMALMWEHVHRFSPFAQSAIEQLVPFTSRLETLHPEQLLAAREDWVLKSDYGAEGDEVVIGRLVTEEVWRASLAHARPGRWVAQRYFDAKRDARGEVTNYGVFVVAGEAAGLYARRHAGMTDVHARSVPVFIAKGDGG